MAAIAVLMKGSVYIAKFAALAALVCSTVSALTIAGKWEPTRAMVAVKAALVVLLLVLGVFLRKSYKDLIHALNHPDKM